LYYIIHLLWYTHTIVGWKLFAGVCSKCW